MKTFSPKPSDVQREWFVVDAEPGDAFTSEPEQLWRTVLSRQTGRLAWYAHYPIDIHTN